MSDRRIRGGAGGVRGRGMGDPVIYDLRKDADAARFGVSATRPGRNDPARSERDYLLASCFPNRGGAKPAAIVDHIQEGVTWGSLDWWINGRDGQGRPIQASATVMIQRDGSILRVIPERDGPWTNGDVIQPTAQSAWLRGLGGNPNAHTLSIEHEGHPDQPLTPAQLAASVWQHRDWSRRYGIPLTEERVLPHSSLNSVGRARCPSGAIYEQIAAALADDTPATAYAEPDPIPELAGKEGEDVAIATAAGIRVAYWWLPRSWHVLKPTPVLRWADRGSARLRADLQPGESFAGHWWFTYNGEAWIYSPFHSRIPARDLAPRVTVTAV